MMTKEAKFDTLYEKHWSELYVFAYNVIRDKAIAEDIVQEVFVDFWTRMSNVDVELPRAYLFQAVRNQCAKSLVNKKFNNVQIENIAALVPDLDEQGYDHIKQQLLKEINHTAKSLLPSKCLTIFQMRFHEQLSYKEIASKLEISESTVENQINKALKLLRGNTKYISDIHFSLLCILVC